MGEEWQDVFSLYLELANEYKTIEMFVNQKGTNAFIWKFPFLSKFMSQKVLKVYKCCSRTKVTLPFLKICPKRRTWRVPHLHHLHHQNDCMLHSVTTKVLSQNLKALIPRGNSQVDTATYRTEHRKRTLEGITGQALSEVNQLFYFEVKHKIPSSGCGWT